MNPFVSLGGCSGVRECSEHTFFYEHTFLRPCPRLVTAIPKSDSAGLGGPNADQERHLQPLPVAVDVLEAAFTQPAELRLDVDGPVRGVLVLERLADRLEEGAVQARRRRGDVLEVGEDAARLEQLECLSI